MPCTTCGYQPNISAPTCIKCARQDPIGENQKAKIIRKRSANLGVLINQSEVIRTGLNALDNVSDDELKNTCFAYSSGAWSTQG